MTQLEMPGVPPPRPSDVTFEERLAIVREQFPHESDDNVAAINEAWREEGWRYADGYKIARRLDDDYGFDPDADLVSDLDDLSCHGHRKLNEKINEWVKQHDITPPLPAGTLVSRSGRTVGFIVDFKLAEAEYLVKKEGGAPDLYGTRYNYEDVEAVAP